MSIDSKPTIVNSIEDNGSLGFTYRDVTSDSVKFMTNSCCASYRYLNAAGNEKIVYDLNEMGMECVYGIGCHFKFKGDGNIYTYMNNSYGCAGTGIEDGTTDSYDSWAKHIYDADRLLRVVGLVASDVWQMHDVYSYRIGFGMKTYYVTNDRRKVYVSGTVAGNTFILPMEVFTTEDEIVKCHDLEYGGFLYLQRDGRLYYWGDNDKNYICSNQDKSYVNPVLLGTDIQDIWVMGSVCVYKKGNEYYFFGYCREGYAKYLIGLDTQPNTRYPFPGGKLTHLPFSDTAKIKDIHPLKYGVGVLMTDGNLYITGKDEQFNVYDEKCKLESIDVEEMAFSNGYTLAYRRKGEIFYRVSDGSVLSTYMVRSHKYHPSIGVIHNG